MVHKEDSLDKTREKIAKVLTEDCVNDEGNCPMPVNTLCKYCISDKILDIIKEEGWIDPSSCVMPGEFGTPKAKEILHEWATANGYIKKPLVMPVLSDGEIRWKLEQIQPEGFDWANATPIEMIKYRAIAQAEADLIKKSLEERNENASLS